MGDLAGALKAEGKEIAESPVSAAHLGHLIALIATGKISGKLAKEVFPKMLVSGEAPETIMEREGLSPSAMTGALAAIIDQAIAANPKQLEQYAAAKPPSSDSLWAK